MMSKELEECVENSADEKAEQISEAEEHLEEAVEAEEHLDETIDSLKDEINILNDKLLRTIADTQNYKKRLAQDTDHRIHSTMQVVFGDILEIIDNLERALANIEDEKVKVGIELIYNQLARLLEKNGVSKIEALGLPFDHNLHQAVMMENNEEKESGIVLEEMLCGYKFKDKVLRPSMVKVNE